jgi:hypothetical protein
MIGVSRSGFEANGDDGADHAARSRCRFLARTWCACWRRPCRAPASGAGAGARGSQSCGGRQDLRHGSADLARLGYQLQRARDRWPVGSSARRWCATEAGGEGEDGNLRPGSAKGRMLLKTVWSAGGCAIRGIGSWHASLCDGRAQRRADPEDVDVQPHLGAPPPSSSRYRSARGA